MTEVNLRNVTATKCSADGQLVARDLGFVPGVVLKPGDNWVKASWLNQLPAGLQEQLNEWTALGYIERLPAEGVSP
jgi:hypothetical protein